MLDLSEAQEESISNRIDAARPEIDALREKARRNFTALRDLDPQASGYSNALQNAEMRQRFDERPRGRSKSTTEQ